jgi:hypothetical protein
MSSKQLGREFVLTFKAYLAVSGFWPRVIHAISHHYRPGRVVALPQSRQHCVLRASPPRSRSTLNTDKHPNLGVEKNRCLAKYRGACDVATAGLLLPAPPATMYARTQKLPAQIKHKGPFLKEALGNREWR